MTRPEPVGELLAAMERPGGATLTIDSFGRSGAASLLTRRLNEDRYPIVDGWEMAHGDTPLAALAALAEAIRSKRAATHQGSPPPPDR